jgi:hypothetical protein
MVWRLRRIAAAVLTLWLCAPALAQQQSPNIIVNVTYHLAAGRVLVNGVPVQSFATDPRARPDAPDPTVVVSLAPWLNNGHNTIVVESRPRAAAGFAEIRILRTLNEPELLGKRITGQGTAERGVTVTGVPRWAWLDSQPWTGDPRAVIASVRDLHGAFARKNTAAFDATRQAMERDLGRAYGPIPPKEREAMHQFITRAQLLPLNPDELTVGVHYGGRLFVVSRPDGSAPIQAYTGSERSPQTRMDTGQYWVLADGFWQVVR